MNFWIVCLFFCFLSYYIMLLIPLLSFFCFAFPNGILVTKPIQAVNVKFPPGMQSSGECVPNNTWWKWAMLNTQGHLHGNKSLRIPTEQCVNCTWSTINVSLMLRERLTHWQTQRKGALLFLAKISFSSTVSILSTEDGRQGSLLLLSLFGGARQSAGGAKDEGAPHCEATSSPGVWVFTEPCGLQVLKCSRNIQE